MISGWNLGEVPSMLAYPIYFHMEPRSGFHKKWNHSVVRNHHNLSIILVLMESLRDKENCGTIPWFGTMLNGHYPGNDGIAPRFIFWLTLYMVKEISMDDFRMEPWRGSINARGSKQNQGEPRSGFHKRHQSMSS